MNVLIWLLMVLGSLPPAQAPAVYPDISGVWRSADGSTTFFHQDGPAVWFDYNNARFDHHSEGKFVSQSTLHLTQIRRNKATNCITYMKLTCELNIPRREMRVLSENLDSNCDLRQGDVARYILYKVE
jgi:hypothetical protein